MYLLNEYHRPLKYPPPHRIVIEAHIDFAITSTADVRSNDRRYRIRYHQSNATPFYLVQDQVLR